LVIFLYYFQNGLYNFYLVLLLMEILKDIIFPELEMLLHIYHLVHQLINAYIYFRVIYIMDSISTNKKIMVN